MPDRAAVQRALWHGALIVIVLVAAGVRFHALGDQSLWNDEGSSFVQSTRDLPAIIDNAARDIHPPGYYALLAIWRLLAGTSEFALRALSTFAGVITVAAAFALGRQLYGSGAGAFAALIVALNSFAVYYAQEARMYTLLSMWGALALLALIALFKRPAPRRAVLLGLLNAAGLWTHYGYTLVMLAQGIIALVWLLREKPARGWRWYVGANALTILLFAAWLPTVIAQLTTWREAPLVYTLPEALNYTINTLIYGVTLLDVPAAIPILLLAFALFVPPTRAIWRVVFAPTLVIVPLAIFFGADLYRPDDLKALLPAQTAFALWIAGGGAALWQLDRGRATRLFARAAAILSAVWLIAALAGGLPPLYDDPAYQRADYRAIARALASLHADNAARNAIILNASGQAEVFHYYYAGSAPVIGLPRELTPNDDAIRAEVEALIREHDQIAVVFWGEDERDPRRVVETTLNQGAFALDAVWFGDVRLARYATPTTLTTLREPDAQFGEHITLARAEWNGDTFRAGDALRLRLTWITHAPLATRYKVFVQLLNADGVLAAQRDSEPGGDLALTTTWRAGETVTDQHALALDLPAGVYTLIVGLYDLDHPDARLPVEGESFYTLGALFID